ncbi:HNH endonuclease [Halococcus hamelinensis]|nr:HNH endonuclease [Halococcus hamelinensis]
MAVVSRHVVGGRGLSEGERSVSVVNASAGHVDLLRAGGGDGLGCIDRDALREDVRAGAGSLDGGFLPVERAAAGLHLLAADGPFKRNGLTALGLFGGMAEYGEAAYRNERVLHNLYVEEDMEKKAIADVVGCSQRTVRKYVREFGLKRRHRDPDVLRELYVERGLTATRTAEELGVHRDTISTALDDFDIERHGPSEYRRKAHLSKPVPLQMFGGYEMWQHSTGLHTPAEKVFVHRLLAVAVYGFEAVVGHDVHHENECRFDNRPSNVVLKTRSEHTAEHNPRHFTDEEATAIRRRYETDDGVTQKALADSYGVSRSLIGKVIHGRGGYSEPTPS